jgi:hypothetical protein
MWRCKSAVTGSLIIALVLIASNATKPPPPYVPSNYDGLLLDLDEDAIKQAYKSQVERLFEIWMRDDSGQPQRALTGVHQARAAFVAAMTELDKRRKEKLQ